MKEFDSMSMTPDNTAQTRRDLTDELTPEQIARLEQSERQYRHNALRRRLLHKSVWESEPTVAGVDGTHSVSGRVYCTHSHQDNHR
jgi:hypothetical protein